MAQTRPNKIITITNDEAFDLATHLARMADSTNVIVNVNSQAEADAISPKYAGLAVRRLDIGWEAIDVWTGSAWFGATTPYGHAGRTGAFQTIQTSTPTRVQITTAQELRGGMTFSDVDDALIVPVTGRYRVHTKYFFTGPASTICQGSIIVNGTVGSGQYAKVAAAMDKTTGADVFAHGYGVCSFIAGDKVAVSIAANACNTWGDTGYDGAFIELEWTKP